MATADFRARWLCECLYAMAHLPAGTEIPGLNANPSAEIIRQMMALPLETDLIGWLANAYPDRVATSTLAWAVRNIQVHVRGLIRTFERWPELVEQDRHFFGKLLELEPEGELLQRLATSRSPGHAIRTLRQLQRRRAGSDVLPEGDTGDHLMNEILSLTVDVDPRRWIKENRLLTASEVIFCNLVQSCLPKHSMDVGRPQYIDQPNEIVEVPGLRIQIKEVILAESGISIAASAWFSEFEFSPPLPSNLVQPHVSWLGFDRVYDDLGNFYLWQGRERKQPVVLDIKQAFYPGVPPEASRLTFEASPVLLDLEAFEVGEDNSLLRTVSLAPMEIAPGLRWSLTIPPERRT